MMQPRRIGWIALLLCAASLVAYAATRDEDDAPTQAPPPVLSVTLTVPESSTLPARVSASGRVAAWQEATIGAEVDGLRLVAVHVNVGDVVTRGQVLAVFDAAIVQADLAEADAAVSLADAELDEARSTARRARNLEPTGALSAQQVEQAVATAATAEARRDAARAAAQRQRLRLARTRVLAPGDGVISARSASVGAVVAAGEALFGLIEDGRLEWRAAVAMADLETLAPGQVAVLHADGHAPVRGQVRMLAPTIDAGTQDGLVYVDLPLDTPLRAGAFARGEIRIGDDQVLTLPDSAVLQRDGFSYVMQVQDDATVHVRKIGVGRRSGDRIEITEGLASTERVIAAGLGFLGDGDIVRVVDAAAVSAAPASAGAAP